MPEMIGAISARRGADARGGGRVLAGAGADGDAAQFPDHDQGDDRGAEEGVSHSSSSGWSLSSQRRRSKRERSRVSASGAGTSASRPRKTGPKTKTPRSTSTCAWGGTFVREA